MKEFDESDDQFDESEELDDSGSKSFFDSSKKNGKESDDATMV